VPSIWPSLYAFLAIFFRVSLCCLSSGVWGFIAFFILFSSSMFGPQSKLSLFAVSLFIITGLTIFRGVKSELKYLTTAWVAVFGIALVVPFGTTTPSLAFGLSYAITLATIFLFSLNSLIFLLPDIFG